MASRIRVRWWVRVGFGEAPKEGLDLLALHQSGLLRLSRTAAGLRHVFPAAAGGGGWRIAAARASIQLRSAIRQPSAKNAPGGRIATRKPG